MPCGYSSNKVMVLVKILPAPRRAFLAVSRPSAGEARRGSFCGLLIRVFKASRVFAFSKIPPDSRLGLRLRDVAKAGLLPGLVRAKEAEFLATTTGQGAATCPSANWPAHPETPSAFGPDLGFAVPILTRTRTCCCRSPARPGSQGEPRPPCPVARRWPGGKALSLRVCAGVVCVLYICKNNSILNDMHA